MNNGWIDIKDAEAGEYIFASSDEENVELITLDYSGFIEGVDINGCEWSGYISGGVNGYVKKAKATELCPLLGGES